MNKLDPLLFETESNFEAMAGAFSPDTATIEFITLFRACHDYAAMRFNTEDSYMHGNHTGASYPTDRSLADVSLSFSIAYSGVAADYRDIPISQSLVLEYANMQFRYVTLGFLGAPIYCEESFSFYTGADITLGHQWLRWFDKSFSVHYAGWVVTGYRDIFDGDGNYLGTEEIKEWMEGDVEDPIMDNKLGILHYTPGIVYSTDITVKYWYCDPVNYCLDFNNLCQGVSRQDPLFEHCSTENLQRVSFPLVATYFNPANPSYTGNSEEGRITFSSWQVSGSGAALPDPPPAAPEHPFRFAEGYDDEYYRNPKRLVEIMYHLGYRKCVDLYIGASHFYDKKGKAAGLPSGYTNAVLVPETGCNTVFLRWFTDYVQALKEKGFERFVLSISMENLQMPDSWKQLLADGSTPGQTGWYPPTCFYSPTHPEVRAFISTVATQLMAVVNDAGFPVVLQLGEPWWWWQEFRPGDVSTPFPGRPPCFYDTYTQELYREEKGKSMPRWYNSDIDVSIPENQEALLWLQEKLGEYSDFMKSLITTYITTAEYGILFFPPSVIDSRRVPLAMRIANMPYSHWKYPSLDYLQVEDYDWIIGESGFHGQVFDFAYDFFGYQEQLTEYFSGFVLVAEEASGSALWKRIELAAQKAISRGMEAYLWAGTQIRRDNFSPSAEFRYITRCQNGYPNSKRIICQPYQFGTGDGEAGGSQNVLDLTALELSKLAGQKIAAGQSLTLYNYAPESDLFAYAWIPVAAEAAYELRDDMATQMIYIYSDMLYGSIIATLAPGNRSVEFATRGISRVLLGFYCMTGSNIAEWSNVLMFRK